MASTKAVNRFDATRSVGVRRLVRYGLFAVIAASIVTVLVLLLGLGMFEFPFEVIGGPFGPLAVGLVVGNSTVAAIEATPVYGIGSQYAGQPNRTFTILAGVLVLSFAMFRAPGLSSAPPSVFALLAVMHVTAAVTIVGVLTRATNQGGES